MDLTVYIVNSFETKANTTWYLICAHYWILMLKVSVKVSVVLMLDNTSVPVLADWLNIQDVLLALLC